MPEPSHSAVDPAVTLEELLAPNLLVVTGKGGVGKTTVAAALCHALSSGDAEVVALDADGSPNLALSLGGGDPEQLRAVTNDKEPPAADACGSDRFTPAGLMSDYATPTDSGARLMQTGRIERPADRCLCCGSHATAREVLAALPGDRHTVVVADLEPGANDLLWAKPQPGDVLVVVTDASRKALEVAGNLLTLAGELGVTDCLVVANKLRDGEEAHVSRALGRAPTVSVAYDAQLDGITPDHHGPDGLDGLVGHLAQLQG